MPQLVGTCIIGYNNEGNITIVSSNKFNSQVIVYDVPSHINSIQIKNLACGTGSINHFYQCYGKGANLIKKDLRQTAKVLC